MTAQEQNVEAVQSLLVGIEEGDVDRVLSELDEDARWIAGTKECCGRDRIAAMLTKMGPSHLANAQIHADGDQVFAEYEKGDTHALAVFELTFGKVREVREYTA